MASDKGMDPKITKKLLDKLSTDNDFRRAFKANPYAALESLGWQRPPGTKDKPAIARIAPKEKIIRDRAKIEGILAEEGSLPFKVCAGCFSTEI